MNLLIIGGTAYFGTDTVELGLTICTRGNTRPPFWDRVSHIAVDRTDPQAFAKALRGKSFDAVIDNIAYTAEEVVNALDVFKGNIGRYILTTSAVVFLYFLRSLRSFAAITFISLSNRTGCLKAVV
ncbi:MAG: hypothetical protein F7O42_01805 [Opitutae bacterium]|nr:hypothetical protein [Opitutae bacterium]